MLEMDYLERMEMELLEEQLMEDWGACVIIAWPVDEYDYAA